ncbi:hypothetical protein [Rhodopirellula sallentina]|uniref:Putative membrane protein n=1 Tax=Rhodopirellula sallentina SM41 TaxID=1263870 RepID=M5TY91_9BACT|nr:hypothetical protein [Rhodopirellula sallentina]EMI54182.1 putative membrane protein [Rhodopirellula sallentina SM41]
MSDAKTRGFVIAPGSVLPEYLRAEQAGQLPGVEGGGVERSPWAVLTVLFVVTGAFGLPLLWRNDRFSLAGKCFWSVAVTVYTVALFYGMFLVVRWSLGDAAI